MKAFYLRETDGEKFLIPEQQIKEFDKLVKKIESEDGDMLYLLEDEFSDKFWGYKCEGELYDTKLYIKL